MPERGFEGEGRLGCWNLALLLGLLFVIWAGGRLEVGLVDSLASLRAENEELKAETEELLQDLEEAGIGDPEVAKRKQVSLELLQDHEQGTLLVPGVLAALEEGLPLGVRLSSLSIARREVVLAGCAPTDALGAEAARVLEASPCLERVVVEALPPRGSGGASNFRIRAALRPAACAEAASARSSGGARRDLFAPTGDGDGGGRCP